MGIPDAQTVSSSNEEDTAQRIVYLEDFNGQGPEVAKEFQTQSRSVTRPAQAEGEPVLEHQE